MCMRSKLAQLCSLGPPAFRKLWLCRKREVACPLAHMLRLRSPVGVEFLMRVCPRTVYVLHASVSVEGGTRKSISPQHDSMMFATWQHVCPYVRKDAITELQYMLI